MMCDVWAAVCQPFVKHNSLYDDDDDDDYDNDYSYFYLL